jgi:hypothetical protein
MDIFTIVRTSNLIQDYFYFVHQAYESVRHELFIILNKLSFNVWHLQIMCGKDYPEQS